MARAPIHSCAWACSAVLIAAGSAAAQERAGEEGGPVIVQPHEPWRFLRLDRFDSAIELFGQSRRDQMRSLTGPDLTDTEDILRETFNLSGRAFIGHENFIDLTADARIGLEDRWLDSDSAGVNEHESNLLDLYNIRALVLGKGPAPVTVHTLRDESLQDREFAGSLDSTTLEHGVSIQLFPETAPTTLSYFHRDQDQSDQFGTFDSHVRQDNFTASGSWTPAPNQNITLDYTFDDIEEEQNPGISIAYQRHNGILTHTLNFGPTQQHSLRSNVHVFDQEGDFAQQQLRLDEMLLLEHSSRLESRYNVSLEQQETGGVLQRTVRGDASVRHRLFESLVSTLGGGALYETVGDDFTSSQVFANLSEEYTKKVPYGQLDAAAGVAINRTDNSDRGTPIQVFDEPHVFIDPLPVVLSRQNIEPASVLITDVPGTFIFVEGIDYTARALPDRVEIFRVVGGSIASGQTVLIDYVIGPEPANTIDTLTTTVSARYSINQGWLNGLAVYVNYQQIDHWLDTEFPSLFVLDDSRRLLYGAEYRLGNVALLGEREERESTVSPSETLRLAARYDRSLGPWSSLNLSFTHEDIDYTADNNRVQLDRAMAQWRQRLGTELDLLVRLLYRDENNRFAGDSRGFEQTIEVHWRRRQTEIYGSFHNSMLEGENADTLSQTITVGLRRRF